MRSRVRTDSSEPVGPRRFPSVGSVSLGESLSRQSSKESCLCRGDLDASGHDGTSSRQADAVERDKEPQSTAVRVVVRFRPTLSEDEISPDRSPAFVVKLDTNAVETVDMQHRFNLDMVFDQDASQSIVYEDIALPLVNDVLQGYHGTILAYGQTGGGKTYCMFGPQGHHPRELQGLVPRAAKQIFENVGSGHVECNFVEVYCEQIRDLLTTGTGKLQVKEMPNKGFWVEGLTHKAVRSTAEVLQVVRVGLKQRAAANTRLNHHSSRSHAIFTLHVVQHSHEGTVRHGKLTMVDLAGSEKVRKSGSVGEMLDEAKKINSSLSTLGHVIDALAERRPHVPYRDSRLTRILEDSLGGNCRTTLLVACSPCSAHAAETMSALRFAGRAKKVCNMVRLPQWTHPADRQLLVRIASLRRELAKAHHELEKRMEGKTEPGSAQAVRSPSKSSPRKTHRPQLNSWDEELITDSGGTGCQPRLLSTQSVSSFGSLCMGSPHRHSVDRTLPEVRPDFMMGTSGASREDAVEPKASQVFPTRVVDDCDLHLAPSPQASSDAASTAVGSASASSSAALVAGSTSLTPLSSVWDAADDDLVGRRMSWQVEARKSDRSVVAPPARSVIGSLEAVLANEQESDAERNAGDVRLQQDLHWMLELERHRNAALNFELDRRAQESQDLRRQLEVADLRRQLEDLYSRSPGYMATETPRLSSSGASLPMLPHLAAPAAATIVTSSDVSHTPSHNTLHAVQLGTVIQRSSSNSQAPMQRGQVVTSNRTPSHSPLRHQRSAYSGGLQHAQSSNASWTSPRQATSYRSSLRKCGSQPALRYVTTTTTTIVPPAVAVSSQTLPSHLNSAQVSSQGPAVVIPPRAPLEPPVPMVPGAAAEKAIAELRQDLQRWVESVNN